MIYQDVVHHQTGYSSIAIGKRVYRYKVKVKIKSHIIDTLCTYSLFDLIFKVLTKNLYQAIDLMKVWERSLSRKYSNFSILTL